MEKVVIKRMESQDEINGKGYVHYKSRHETYTGLIDVDYLTSWRESGSGIQNIAGKCRHLKSRGKDSGEAVRLSLDKIAKI